MWKLVKQHVIALSIALAIIMAFQTAGGHVFNTYLTDWVGPAASMAQGPGLDVAEASPEEWENNPDAEFWSGIKKYLLQTGIAFLWGLCLVLLALALLFSSWFSEKYMHHHRELLILTQRWLDSKQPKKSHLALKPEEAQMAIAWAIDTGARVIGVLYVLGNVTTPFG